MSHHIFPVDWVFWTKAQNHERNKNFISEQINKKLNITKDDHVGIWSCDVNTEFFNPETHKYVDVVVTEIYPALDKMFDEIDTLIKPKTSTVTNIWYNKYDKGQNQEVHSHFGSDISGIYLLDLNEENTTAFYSFGASTTNTAKEIYKANKLQEGDIVLFPSHLLHYVLPSVKQRTTIAFNINCEFEK